MVALREVTSTTAKESRSAARGFAGLRAASLVALWFGLAAGMLESLVAMSLRGRSGFVIRVSPEILWIAPAFNVTLFLLLSTALVALFRLRGKAPDSKLLVGLFSWAMLFSPLLLSGLMHQVAALILSLGIAVQIARSLRGREGRAVQLFRQSLKVLIAGALLLGLAGGLWDRLRESSMVGHLPPARSGAPNLLLITLDTLRADHVSSYGYDRNTTPNIDRLAKGGALFESAFSNCSWTLPAHASLFTGRLPHEHRADWAEPLNGEYTTLAEVLASQGYITSAFSANASYVAPEWGLARGFSRFETYGDSIVADITTTVYGKKLALNLLPRLGYYDIPGRKRASELNREFFRWLDGAGGRPFFAFLNYFDLHDPYLTVAPLGTQFSSRTTRGNLINFQFQASSFRRKTTLSTQERREEEDGYDGCLAYLDQELGQLVAELEERGLSKNTLIVVTSDHGEAFGNHDLFGHGNSLYLETLHVPLIFYWPDKIASGVHFSQTVGLNQVPSTVMELLGNDYSLFPGESLYQLLTGNAYDRAGNAVLSELNAGRFKEGPPNYPTTGGGLKSLVTDRWHFIVSESGRTELYDRRIDPQEQHNSADDPEAGELVQQLRQHLESLSIGLQGPRVLLRNPN